MATVNLVVVAQVRAQLAARRRPAIQPLTGDQLQRICDKGNNRRPLPRDHSDSTKLNIVNGQRRWRAFCAVLPDRPEWRSHVKSLSWENRGLAEAFVRYFMQRAGSRITSLGTVRVYLRQLSAVYYKYAGEDLEWRVRAHFLAYAKLEIKPKFALRIEPKRKKYLGPEAFAYLAWFRWVRDRTAFKLGLDRLDDALVRIFLMWTGCRRHELLYARPKNLDDKLKEYDDDLDAFTDVDDGDDEYIKKREPVCWVCGKLDERTDPKYQVLCWEDIDLWILRDPLGDGHDRLAMQVLLRFHKGNTKQRVPTWFPFIEEDLPFLCPISLILAKAGAEGAFGGDFVPRAESFFGTKLTVPALKITWKEEFMHKPVFRETIRTPDGRFVKSDEPANVAMFDRNTATISLEGGLEDPLTSYDYRRGYFKLLDRKSFLS